MDLGVEPSCIKLRWVLPSLSGRFAAKQTNKQTKNLTNSFKQFKECSSHCHFRISSAGVACSRVQDIMHRDRGVRGSLLLFPPLPPLPPFLDHGRPHFPWPCFCDVPTIWAPGTRYSPPGRTNRISYRDTSSNRLSQHPSCLRHSRCN